MVKFILVQSINIIERFKQHKINSNGNIIHPLYNAIKSYELNNFEFIIIEQLHDISKLDEREQYWITYYKSNDRNFGYNLRLYCTTNRGYKHSEESKLKMREKSKGKIISDKTREKMSLTHKDKPKSEEAKLNMAKAQKGRMHSEETKLKIGLKNKGKHRIKWSEKTRQKMREARKLFDTEEYRNKLSKSVAEWWASRQK